MITGRRAYPRWLIRGLIVFAIGMTAFASVASREHHAADNARNAALSRYVALESRELESSDPALAMQLALVSYRLSQTSDARSALVDATAGEMPTRRLGRPGQDALALGDDGHRLVIANKVTNTVSIYALRYAQLTPLATVQGTPGRAHVVSVALTDNGRLLAAGDSRGRTTLWSLSAAAHPRRLAVLYSGVGAVRGLSFSPRGAALATAESNGELQRWSLADPRAPDEAAQLVSPGRAPLDAVSYSPNGTTLAATTGNGELLVWPAHAGTKPLSRDTLESTALTALDYSPGGHTLAVGAAGGQVAILKLGANGATGLSGMTALNAGASVNALAFSRDGRYLAAGTAAKSVPVWSTAGGRLVASLPHPSAVSGLAFTDGDRRLVSGDLAGTTMLWQFPAPSTYTFSSPVTAVAYSTTSPRLAVTLQSGRTDTWNVVSEWRPAPLGAWYATAASSGPLNAYWRTPPNVLTMTTTTPTGTVTSGTTTTASGTTTAGTRFVVLNPHAGDLALRRTEAQTKVTSSLLSNNDQYFVAATGRNSIWLWDVADPASPKLLRRLSGFSAPVTSMVFSIDSGTLFASSADHTIRIWGLSALGHPEQLPSSPLLGPSTPITRLVLSPDGRTLAAATVGGHVWLWSVGNPAKASLSGNLIAARGRLSAISFSPSDNVLAAGGANQRLTFWHYRPYQAVNRICALEGTPITANEWSLYVPGASYRPPCAKWKPPVAKTVTPHVP